MTDREINLHPKNNPSVNLKPNIVHGNIPEKAVSFKQLDENIQNKIDSQSFQIAKNTADISSLREKIDDEASTREDEDSRVRDEMTEYADHIKSDLEEKISTNKTDIAKNTNNVASILTLIDIDNAKINPSTLENSIDGSDDVIVDVDNDKLEIHLSDELRDTISTHTSTIATNTANITKNTSAISSLETRTKNLEDTKVSVNTGTFDPTSDNPASQKSVYNMPTLMANIVDSHGNKRFVDGDIEKTSTNKEIEKIYGKWSLSGTHLLLVFCFKHLANKTLGQGGWMAYAASLPSYIMNKIVPISGNIVGIFPYYRGTSNTSSYISLIKIEGRLVLVYYGNSYTPVADEISRVQIDLLIDSE